MASPVSGPFGSSSISAPPLPDRRESTAGSSSRQGLASAPSTLESMEEKKGKTGFLGKLVKVGNAIKDGGNRIADFRNSLIDPDGVFTGSRPRIFREGGIYETSIGIVEIARKNPNSLFYALAKTLVTFKNDLKRAGVWDFPEEGISDVLLRQKIVAWIKTNLIKDPELVSFMHYACKKEAAPHMTILTSEINTLKEKIRSLAIRQGASSSAPLARLTEQLGELQNEQYRLENEGLSFTDYLEEIACGRAYPGFPEIYAITCMYGMSTFVFPVDDNHEPKERPLGIVSRNHKAYMCAYVEQVGQNHFNMIAPHFDTYHTHARKALYPEQMKARVENFNLEKTIKELNLDPNKITTSYGTVIEQTADGNCLYYSFAEGLFQHKEWLVAQGKWNLENVRESDVHKILRSLVNRWIASEMIAGTNDDLRSLLTGNIIDFGPIYMDRLLNESDKLTRMLQKASLLKEAFPDPQEIKDRTQRALVISIPNYQERITTLESLIRDYLKNGVPLKTYLEEIAKDKVYADSAEIYALCKMYGLTAVIHQADSRHRVTGDLLFIPMGEKREDRPEIHLEFIPAGTGPEKNHYNFVIPT